MARKPTKVKARKAVNKKGKTRRRVTKKKPVRADAKVDPLLTELRDFRFELNEWGSVQYSGALHAYKIFLSNYEGSGKDLKAVFSKFEKAGFKFSMRPVSQDFAIKAMKDELLKDTDAMYPKDEPSSTDYRKKALEGLEEIGSPEDAIKFCRGSAWDLWAAVAFVAKHCGIELLECPKAPGIGPEANVWAQSENFDTGVLCALLKVTGHVSSEDSFRDYDT